MQPIPQQFTGRVQVKNSMYYQIVNLHYKYALYVSSGSKDFEHEKAYLDELKPKSLGQVWQIIQVDPDGFRKKDLFQFVHTRSTLVLTRVKDDFLKKLFHKSEQNQVKLRFGKWDDNQLFYLDQVNPNDLPNIYRFRSLQNSKAFLFFHNFLRLEEIDPSSPKCHWQIKPCYDNEIINRSCYLQNAYSNLAVDVPEGSHKRGVNLIQYPLNNRFNQRFNIYKSGEYFKISNLNSKLFLSCSKKPIAGDLITQEDNVDELYQMWNLEYQGKNLYIIRSAQNAYLMIGIKEHNTKAESRLLLTSNQEYALWRIVGFVPV